MYEAAQRTLSCLLSSKASGPVAGKGHDYLNYTTIARGRM